MTHPGTSEPGRIPPRVLMAVVLAALGVRVLHLLQAGTAPEFGVPWLDQQFYHDQAAALASGGEIAFSGFRSLLYPWLVSLVYRVAGPDPVAVIWVQSVLGCIAAGLCATAAWRLAGSAAAALAAGFLFALNPVVPVFECGLLTAAPSLLVMAVFALAMVRALETSARPGWLAAVGMTPALLLHLTPQLAPVLLAPLLFARGGARARMWIVGGFAATLMVLAGLHAGIAGKAFAAGGSSGINAWLGNREGADGIFPKQPRAMSYQGGYQDPIELLALEEARRLTGNAQLPPHRVSGFWWGQTFSEIRSSPGRWMALMIRKAWVSLWNAEPPNVLNPGFWKRHAAPMLAWLPAGWGILLVCAAPALWRSERRTRALAAAVGLGLAGLCLFFVNSRYRLPLIAPMSVLAGVGVVSLRGMLAAKDWKPLVAMAALGLITFVNWGRIEPFPEHPDWMARGEACLARNQAAGAMEAYQTAAKLAPSDLGSWFGLGNGHFAAGQWREAVAAYDRALALDPAHALVHQNRARALDLAGDSALAAQGYRRALELAPGNAMAAGQFAMMLIRTGDLPGARALLARSRPAGEPAPQEEIALAWLHDADRRPADAEVIRARLRTRWGAQIEALFQELPSPPSTP